MNLRRSRRDEPEINLIPLIDILFFLLLFFMLSSTFDRAAALKIDLPNSSAPPSEKSAQDNIEVIIDSAGNYAVNGQQLANNQLETLKRALLGAIGNKDHPPLIISADGKTPHQAVVTAMDAARQAGLLHLSIATRTSTGARR
jgi:biopolymer transport protein ExbD